MSGPWVEREPGSCHALGAERNRSQHGFGGFVPLVVLILGFLGTLSPRPGARGLVKHAAFAFVGTETNPAISSASMECPREDTGLSAMKV